MNDINFIVFLTIANNGTIDSTQEETQTHTYYVFLVYYVPLDIVERCSIFNFTAINIEQIINKIRLQSPMIINKNCF